MNKWEYFQDGDMWCATNKELEFYLGTQEEAEKLCFEVNLINEAIQETKKRYPESKAVVFLTSALGLNYTPITKDHIEWAGKK